jgi:hypothetical protein
MSLKNTETAEIYKDAYIIVYDRYDEPIHSFNSVDSLLQMFKDIDLTPRLKDETIRETFKQWAKKNKVNETILVKVCDDCASNGVILTLSAHVGDRYSYENSYDMSICFRCSNKDFDLKSDKQYKLWQLIGE